MPAPPISQKLQPAAHCVPAATRQLLVSHASARARAFRLRVGWARRPGNSPERSRHLVLTRSPQSSSLHRTCQPLCWRRSSSAPHTAPHTRHECLCETRHVSHAAVAGACSCIGLGPVCGAERTGAQVPLAVSPYPYAYTVSPCASSTYSSDWKHRSSLHLPGPATSHS